MESISKILGNSPLFQNTDIQETLLKSKLSEMSESKRLQLEWAFIYHTLIECQNKIDRAYGRNTWVNPAIDIAKERMKGE